MLYKYEHFILPGSKKEPNYVHIIDKIHPKNDRTENGISRSVPIVP